MNLKMTYDRLKAANPGARITQGGIISENLLNATATNSINFNLKENQPNSNNSGSITVNEQRLKLSDAFCVTSWSIQIRRVTQAGATATLAEIGGGIPYNFVNTTVFTVAAEQTALRNIFNGSLGVTINKQQIYTQYPTRGFENVPTSQKGTTTAAIAGPVAYTIDRDGKKSLTDGFVPLWPTINLQGAWDMNFVLNLPSAVAMGATGNFSNYAVLFLDGFLLQNAANYSFPE